tara:strand:- start:36 stop:326 length:291 start_codon:yes stop_codon:yes gene_type:complete
MSKEIKFSVGGELDMPIYNAVDIHPQRWNGWLRPIVTIEVAEQIAEDIFNHEDSTDNEPYEYIKESIVEAKENFEETVEIGGCIIWDLIEENNNGK